MGCVVLEKVLKLQQISGGFLPEHDDDGKITGYQATGTEKLDLFREILEMQTGKVVVFCRFAPEVQACASAAEEHGLNVITLSGSTPATKRGEIIEKFQNGNADIIVVQQQTGGMGIDLYAASTAIMYSTTYSYAEYDQARARLHRIGQTADKVTYIHLVGYDTIDEAVLRIVQNKKDTADMVLDILRKKKQGASE
jgi:SNF2 family DNA or RNA helicase